MANKSKGGGAGGGDVLAANFRADTSAFITNVGAASVTLERLMTSSLRAKGGLAALTRVGLGVTAAALGANAIRATVDEFFRFEQALLKTNTLVGISMKQTQEWGQQLLEIGPRIGIGPSQLAEGLFGVTSGGLRTVESLELVEQAAKASALGLGNMFDITRTATAATQAFAQDNLTAAQAVDVMVGIVREGSLTTASLATALGRVLGVGATVGATFQDMGAFLAGFTRLGVSAEEAATSLRSTLVKLIKPSKDSAKAFEEIGIPIKEFRRMIKDEGLTESMLMLVAAVDKAPDAVARLFPNVRALTGILSNYAVQAEQTVQIQESMNNIFGVTNEAFKEYEKTGVAALGRLRSAWSTLKIQMGKVFAPEINRIISGTAEGLDLIASGFGLVDKMASFAGDATSKLLDDLVRFSTLATTAPEEIGRSLEEFTEKIKVATIAQLELLQAQGRADIQSINRTISTKLLDDPEKAKTFFEDRNKREAELLIIQRQIFAVRNKMKAQDLGDLLSERSVDNVTLIDKILDDLISKVDKLTNSTREGTIARLESIGAYQFEIDEANKLYDEIDVAARIKKEAQELKNLLQSRTRLVESVQREAELAGLSGTALRIKRGELLGLNDEQLRSLRIASQQIEITRIMEDQEKRVAAIRETNLKAGIRSRDEARELAQSEERRIQDQTADNASDRRLNELQTVTRAYERMAEVVGNAAVDIITLNGDISDSFKNMVENILRELAKLTVRRGIIEPLAGALSNAFLDAKISRLTKKAEGLAGGLTIPTISPSIISGASNIPAPSSQTIVSVPITFAPQLIDGVDGSRWLRQNANSIREVIIEGVNRSTAFRRQIGGRG